MADWLWTQLPFIDLSGEDDDQKTLPAHPQP
jgi:hypothetical protein